MAQTIFIPPSFVQNIHPVHVTNEQDLRDFLDACSQYGLIVNYERTISWCKPRFDAGVKIYLRCDIRTVQASARLHHPDFYYELADLRVETPTSCPDFLDLL